MEKGAIFDNTKKYRYSLWRSWDISKPKVAFVMLNPSIADENIDDQTIRRCINFTKSWGYGSVEIVNLFAFRATDPKNLKNEKDPIGPENNNYINQAVKNSELIIVAWGVHGQFISRNREVVKILQELNKEIFCLGKTKEGHPRHPLYINSEKELEIFI